MVVSSDAGKQVGTRVSLSVVRRNRPLAAAFGVEDDPSRGPAIHHEGVFQVRAVQVVAIRSHTEGFKVSSQRLASHGPLTCH
jgi:hypothetical protein